ncbi:MAG: Hpt domain-containing protein [Anaerolineaceae bacterium]|nr:Hpt domain-containing protein [Anaerolineaceae bacterium]
MLTQAEKKYFHQTPYTNGAVLLEIKEFIGEEGDETVRELVEIYLKKTPILIAKIAEDLRNGETKTFKADIHSLKGSSASVGAISIFTLCKKIEEMIDEENKPQIEVLFAQIIDTFKFVKDDLQAWL